MALGSSRTPHKSRFRARPRWGGRPGASWEPRDEKQATRRELPRAFSRSAQNAHSAAAVERREDSAIKSASTGLAIGAFLDNLVQRLRPQFTQEKPPQEYKVEVQ